MADKKLKVIAHIKTDFKTKFGIPRQSGLIEDAKGYIVFCKDYRTEESLRGIEGFSHLWLLWDFSENKKQEWSPTVRPPRLGGNKRMGVFATRSPYRPNSIGLSSVKLEKIIKTQEYSTVLEVSGVDMLDGTPIYDIKPYIAYTDSHPNALGGFSKDVFEDKLEVIIPDECKKILTEDSLKIVTKILESNPRPTYIYDQNRIFSFEYKNYNIKFRVSSKTLTVVGITII